MSVKCFFYHDMFKTLSYFIFWNFLNFKASGKSFMILRHKSTVSISSILSWTTIGKSTWLTLVMFDIATMKTVYQMQPCITNDTNLKKVLQLLFLFFFSKLSFFFWKLFCHYKKWHFKKRENWSTEACRCSAHLTQLVSK